MAWPIPSKPCLWLHGPPAPKAVTVVRMMSGFTRRRLSRSSARWRSTSGGRLATTTSAVATSFFTISRPFGDDGSSVIARLLRFMTRNIAPTPSSPTGATQRTSPPPSRSMRMTSAPRSASSAAQYGPAMYRPKSSTRMPARTSGIALVEHQDGARHLTGLHRAERLVDVLQAAAPRDHLVELEPALAVEL